MARQNIEGPAAVKRDRRAWLRISISRRGGLYSVHRVLRQLRAEVLNGHVHDLVTTAPVHGSGGVQHATEGLDLRKHQDRHLQMRRVGERLNVRVNLVDGDV
jgi:hypothetical protein